VAVIDKDRCLPWAAGTPCVVCEEMCPVPDKAIVLEGDRLVTRPDGGKSRLARPKVVASRCIGCGICEYKCPVEGTSAIVILPTDPDLAGGGAPAAG
jgi:translation initiation factor RLI1